MTTRLPCNCAGRCRGFSIVELMVAMTVTLVILAGVITIFTGSKRTYNVQEGLSRVQENARFATDMMATDIRLAGLQGCDSKSGNLVPFNNVKDPERPLAEIKIDNAILGFEYGDLPTTDGLVSGDVVAGTDIIQVRYGRDSGCPIVNKGALDTGEIKTIPSCDIQQGDILVVSDCRKADVFRATTVSNNQQGNTKNIAHGSNFNISPKLKHTYDNKATLLKFENKYYFIGTGANGGPALFQRRLINGIMRNQELLEGVEDMEILYGLDRGNDGVPDTYLPADQIQTSQWPRVMTVRVGLMMHTTSTAGNTVGFPDADPAAGQVAGEPQRHLGLDFFLTSNKTAADNSDYTTPNDRRLRRLFTSTIRIRNRLR